MNGTGSGEVFHAGATHSLSRRALAQGSAGFAIGTMAFGGLGRAVSARQATATPVPAETPAWEEIDGLFANAAPESTLLAAELVDGTWIPVHLLNADVIQPVGSSFKLWILGALALEIQAGRIEWEQPVEFQELYRSVPGGDLRYALPGSQYTVRYLTERMIQKSDNTATDHMFHLVGREQVEAAMAAMGHSDPALNTPIISTRELALLKFGQSTEFLDEFYAMTPDERRRYLDEDLAQVGVDSLPDIDQDAPPGDRPGRVVRHPRRSLQHDELARSEGGGAGHDGGHRGDGARNPTRL